MRPTRSARAASTRSPRLMCPCHKGAGPFPHRTAVAALQTTASRPTSVGDGYARSCSSHSETSGSTRYRTTSFPGSQAAGLAGPVEEGGATRA